MGTALVVAAIAVTAAPPAAAQEPAKPKSTPKKKPVTSKPPDPSAPKPPPKKKPATKKKPTKPEPPPPEPEPPPPPPPPEPEPPPPPPPEPEPPPAPEPAPPPKIDPYPPHKVSVARTAMREYFAGEKAEGWYFFGAGVASAGAGAAGAFIAKDSLYRGAGYPLMAFGAIQIGTGLVLLLRTDKQIRERDAKLDAAPGTFFADELPRIARVRRSFGWLEAAEIGITAAGIGLLSFGAATRDKTMFGVGTGLAIEGGIMLTFDGVASARADRYDTALRALEAPRRP